MKRKGLALLVLAIGAALSSVMAAAAKQSDVGDLGRREQFVSPLVQQWTPPSGRPTASR